MTDDSFFTISTGDLIKIKMYKFKINNSHLHKTIMRRSHTITLLIFGFISTIALEIFLDRSIQSSSPKITLFEHIQSSLTSIKSIDGFLQRLCFVSFSVLLMGLFIELYTRGILAIYITLLKFFELIPVLIDLMNLLFIYQDKMKDIHQQNSSLRLRLSLILVFMRLAMSLEMVRQKCDRRWKRQILIIFDLLLFILINISLIRYTNPNAIRIGRKIILGLLIFQLNDLFYNETFWTSSTKWNDRRAQGRNSTVVRRGIFSSNLTDMIHLILSIRLIVSFCIICLFVVFTIQPTAIYENEGLFSLQHVYIFLKTRQFDIVMCMIILSVIYWDTLQNRKTLKQHGCARFCIGLDPLSTRRSTEISSHSTENNRSPPVPMKETNQTSSSVSDGWEHSMTKNVSQNTPKRMGIFGLLYKQFGSMVTAVQNLTTKPASLIVGKGIIEIEKGDITEQRVDVIIGSSSSEYLRKVLLKAGGDQVQSAYAKEHENNPNSLIISTPPGHLHCKRIFFLRWNPDKDQEILQQSIVDLIGNVIQNALLHQFISIAFPAIGCGGHGCSVDIMVKTMVREMKQQIQRRKLPWTVKFIIPPNQQSVYDEFCKQLLSLSDHASVDYQIPSTWQNKQNQLRVIVPKDADEYKSIVTSFDKTLKGKYKEIVKIERIQNERWYMQYMVHSKDFKNRLNQDTEKRLYHGCPEQAATLIIQDCFNRSFAGVNGTLYGVGVYFSSKVAYSHQYTKPNSNGERCMFIARVLIGKTTLGNSSMKTRPLGFDSTTDKNHIFVIYHDAQAYAEHMITYK